MRVSPRPLNCERVRSQISMAFDAEVSELDRRLVRAHLARCPECHAFESSVRDFTEELRAAPLERLERPIVLAQRRSRRRAWLTTAEVSAAATVLIGLGVMSQLEASDPQARNRLATATLFSAAWQPELEMAQIDPSVGAGLANDGGPGPLHAV